MDNHSKLKVQNISCILFETQQQGGLFLGNVYGSQNPTILKEYGIRSVLTTSIQTPTQYKKQDIPYHLAIQAHDKDDYQMMQHLDECLAFIEKYRKVTNVFVHCYAGVSRSVTVIVAYLMKKYSWNMQKALDFVVYKRVVAKPNEGFMKELAEYEKKLFKIPVQSPRFKAERALDQFHKKITVYQTQKKIGISSVNSCKIGISSESRIRYNHDHIPIPKILNKQPAASFNNLKNIKDLPSLFPKIQISKQNLLRPRDLPGYGSYS